MALRRKEALKEWVMFLDVTVGFDWEMWIAERSGVPISDERLRKLLPEFERELGRTPVTLDLGQLELLSGICRSAREVKERAAHVHAVALRVAARHGLRRYPAAGHPLIRNFAGGHVHVGSVIDLAAAERARLVMVPWVPALIALATAAPFAQRRHGAHKSYRVSQGALGCLRPIYAQSVGLSQVTWGEDVCLKLREKPTMEVRCMDAASAPELAAELAVLAAGLVVSVGERSAAASDAVVEEAIAPERYLEALANRMNAATHGLQATFVRDGKHLPATEVAREALALAQPGLARLGASADDLPLVRRMVELGVTQADWLCEAAAGARDPFVCSAQLVEACSRVPFARWLEQARPLAPRPHEALVDRLRRVVRGYTTWPRVYHETWLPPAALDAELRREVARGAMELVTDVRRGLAVRSRGVGPERMQGALAPPESRERRQGEQSCIGSWQRSSGVAARVA